MLEGGTEVDYNYPTSGWRDQLLTYNGEQFEYDALGNPTTYRGKSLVWGHLRNLEQFGENIAYTYNASGVRTSKTVNGKTTKFYLNGNKIVAQDDSTNKLYFHYGVDGLAGFTLRKDEDTLKEYYYKKNVQGDILSIYDENYKEIIKYVYDAWGNHKIQAYDGTDFVDINSDKVYAEDSVFANNKLIAELNPFRYRSYYYDNETGLYYLNSRYYDPELGRFVNADIITCLVPNTLNGLNLYAYCLNNPVAYLDLSGNIPINHSTDRGYVYKITENIFKLFWNPNISKLFNIEINKTYQTQTGKVYYTYYEDSLNSTSHKSGIGINSNSFTLEAFVSTDLDVGINMQLGHFHFGTQIGVSGIGLNFGLDNGNKSFDVSINIGWTTMATAAVVTSLIVAPIPGARLATALIIFGIFISNLFK